MKLITAFIRPEKLHDVKCALFAETIYSMSVTNVLGAGQQKGYTEIYRGVMTEVNLLKKLRLELGVADDRADAAVRAIAEAGRTGKEGDGVVFVSELVAAQRIRTGEAL